MVLKKCKDFVLPTEEYLQVPTKEQIICVNGKFIWKVFLIGPINTPYQGYKWTVQIDFPQNFPFSEPIITFVDKIFHPNISFITGTTYLFEQWGAQEIYKLFNNLNKILITPNLDQPLNSIALTLLKKPEYPLKVILYAEEHKITKI